MSLSQNAYISNPSPVKHWSNMPLNIPLNLSSSVSPPSEMSAGFTGGAIGWTVVWILGASVLLWLSPLPLSGGLNCTGAAVDCKGVAVVWIILSPLFFT